jgi:hypothetical protein
MRLPCTDALTALHLGEWAGKIPSDLTLEESMSARILRGLALVLAAAGIGCASTEPPPSPLREHTSLSVAMSASAEGEFWDHDPAPDGLKVRLFFYASQSRKPVAVQGELRLALWPGRVSANRAAKNRAAKNRAAKPLHVWAFTDEELGAHMRKTVIGWSYTFKLDWGDDVPPPGPATLTMHFTPAGSERRLLPARQTVQIPPSLRR